MSSSFSASPAPAAAATAGEKPKAAPYGSWKSPITADVVSAADKRLGGMALAGEGRLLWVEGRPEEKGRMVIVKEGDKPVDVTPKEFAARTLAQEYGGGAFAVEDNVVVFSNYKDQRLYKTAPAESLTTADELFEKGRIRPLKPLPNDISDKGKIRPLMPPPGLLDGGSVGSSPRSPMTMKPPQRRSRVGSGTDFDPFAAALLEASRAPSPLGRKHNGGVASGSLPKKADPFTTRPTSKRAGWRKWRLRLMLEFLSSVQRHKQPSDLLKRFL